MFLYLFILIILIHSKGCFAQYSPWPQTWRLNESTIIMACNSSGDLDPLATGKFAIVDVDWSSGKEQWAKQHPMQNDVSIIRQALAVAAVLPNRRVFVYRNSIKGLPFFSDVHSILSNSSYNAWFVPFGPPTINGSSWHSPPCDTNYHPPLCSTLYHDQVDTPQYPGECEAPACDCGGVPCGEYLFDFRAANMSINGQTFTDWFINDYYFSKTALGHPNISGLYIDDFWSITGGPSEMTSSAVKDMGLSTYDVADMTAAYQWVMSKVRSIVIERGKWMWSEFLNNDPFQFENGGCIQPWVRKTTCDTDLRQLCGNSTIQSRTLVYGFSPGCPELNPANLNTS
jgi:hypothetical protein